MPAGIGPSRKLLVKDRRASRERFPRDDGMVPVMLLLSSDRTESAGRLPISAGMFPFRPLLSWMTISRRLMQRLMLLGMTPVSVF